MLLELLANELLFDLFEYFSSVDLFHAFNGLNFRFDSLLLQYFRQQKHFDFRLIYKEDLSLIRRRYLPLFVDQITSISLSNDDTNPHEIDLFLSRLYPLHRFTHLQSITLSNLYSVDKIDRILDDLQHISHLTDLRLKQCHLQYHPQTFLNLMNKIWSLPSLTDCYVDIISDDTHHFIPPTIISCSLKHLSVVGLQCDLDNLLFLYEHTPYVEHLSLRIYDSGNDYPQLPLLHSVTTLKLTCQTSFRIIQTLLRKMPNLIDLTVETKFLDIDGQKWQDMISKYLPTLKFFHYKMNLMLDECDDIEQEIDRMVDSYRTQFWINQHKWFIRCFCFQEDERYTIDLHTLPYRFEQFTIEIPGNVILKSTCPEDQQHLMYNYVHNLEYDCSSLESEDINLSDIQFSNLRHLTLALPYDDHFQSIVPRFDHLISLKIRMNTRNHDENDLLRLQTILDQAPRLSSLKFHSWLTTLSKAENKNKKNVNTKMPPYIIRSSSVRYLDLQGFTHNGDKQYYNDQQCLSLMESPIGQQCEFLLIEVDKRTSIIDLVTKMKRLRALNVRCRDRKHSGDELMKWLHSRLPSTCTFAKDTKFSNDIRLWIR